MRPITVLLVEDSATVAAYVVSVLGSEADIQLLPVARTAEEGVRAAIERRPNVVLMDIKLPDHDGLWAIEQIMAEKPCPIVVLSGHLSSRERNITFEALRAGAVEVLGKPTGLSPQVRDAFRASLVGTVRLMSSAVVVRRDRRMQQSAPASSLSSAWAPTSNPELERIRCVVVGGSTGGPELLFRILSALPPPFPLPVLVAQHTLEGFDDTLAQWLSGTGHRVEVAREGDVPGPGRVLIGPADKHMRLAPTGVTLLPARRAESIVSVDTMFTSAARIWGERCLAILLTGMGKDGSVGMKSMFDSGALTVAQSSDSCVVASMPDSARALGAVRRTLRPEQIIGLLQEVAQTRTQRPSESDFRKGG